MIIQTHLAHLSVLASTVFISMCASAAPTVPSAQEWSTFTKSAIESHILPQYGKLEASTAKLSQQVQTLCLKPSESALEKTRQSFKNASQSWQGVQHVQFGPVTLLMRNFGMQYWPDKKNIGGKQLRQALFDKDSTFNEDYFLTASVSLKGFPAMEKLIFTKHQGQELLENNSRSCELLKGIAQHVAANGKAISAEWRAESAAMLNPSEEGMYETAEDSATAILKALVEPVEVIRDHKLNAPLGSNSSKIRWRKSESWRSHQSITNLSTNLKTLQHLYSGTSPLSFKQLLIKYGYSEQASLIDTGFKVIRDDIAALTPVQNMDVTEAQYRAMMRISDQLKVLQHQLLNAVANLGLHLGFNSRDGD